MSNGDRNETETASEIASPDPLQKMLRYKSATGEEKTVPVCSGCLDQFVLSAERKDILERCLAVHELLEWNHLSFVQDVSGCCGLSDYFGVQAVKCIVSQIAKAEQLCDLLLEDISACYGSAHIATAVSAFGPDDRAKVGGALGWLGEFYHHLWCWHQERDAVGIDVDTLQVLTKPRYVGRVDVESACRLQRKLADLSVEEMADKLVHLRKQSLEHHRGHVSDLHGGKPDRHHLLQTALENALGVIEANAAGWRQTVEAATECSDLFGVSSTLHVQVFLVDELLGQGVWNDPLSCNGSSIYETMKKIEDLIDWDQCSHLHRFMEEYRRAAASGELTRW